MRIPRPWAPALLAVLVLGQSATAAEGPAPAPRPALTVTLTTPVPADWPLVAEAGGGIFAWQEV